MKKYFVIFTLFISLSLSLQSCSLFKNENEKAADHAIELYLSGRMPELTDFVIEYQKTHEPEDYLEMMSIIDEVVGQDD